MNNKLLRCLAASFLMATLLSCDNSPAVHYDILILGGTIIDGSGAAAYVACEVARQIDSGVVVTILPDGGERYLSTTLFQVTVPEPPVSQLRFFNTLGTAQKPKR